MGSRFTEDRTRMRWVLNLLKNHGLFFLDSWTSPNSHAYEEAQKMGLARARRTVFLDNIQTRKAIRIQLKRLVALATQNGSAIGIGHPYPVTCQSLKSEYNYLKNHVQLVPVTALLSR